MTVTSLDADLSLATPIDLTNVDFADLSDPIDVQSAHAMERLARLESTDVESLRAVSSEIAKELAKFSATLDQKQASAVLRIAASFHRVSHSASLEDVEPMAVGHTRAVAADG